jgi:hypothetical protein
MGAWSSLQVNFLHFTRWWKAEHGAGGRGIEDEELHECMRIWQRHELPSGGVDQPAFGLVVAGLASSGLLAAATAGRLASPRAIEPDGAGEVAAAADSPAPLWPPPPLPMVGPTDLADGVDLGLGRMVALYHSSSSLYQLFEEAIRYLCFSVSEATVRPNPRSTCGGPLSGSSRSRPPNCCAGRAGSGRQV